MATITVSDVSCPTCGNGEMHPDGKRLLIRGHKVHTSRGWSSQCLVCAGFYNASLVETPTNYDKSAGWFY